MWGTLLVELARLFVAAAAEATVKRVARALKRDGKPKPPRRERKAKPKRERPKG